MSRHALQDAMCLPQKPATLARSRTPGPSDPFCRVRGDEGSSLITVLVFIAIISSLVGVVLSLAVLRDRYVRRDVHRLQARYAVEAGIHRALAELNGRLQRTSSVIPVPAGTGHTVPCSVRIAPFGAFARGTASARVQGEDAALRVLAGMHRPPESENAVVFGEDRSNLTLTGDTRITGPMHVGARGVETSSLRGERFTGRIDGEVRRNTHVALPPFDDAALRQALDTANRWLKNPPVGSGDAWDAPRNAPLLDGRRVFYVEGGLTLSASDRAVFEEPALILAPGSVAIEGPVEVPDGTIVVAGQTLRVGGDVTGGHALLIGRQGVQVGGDVDVSAQLVSERQVLIGGHAQLSYPSLAFVAEPTGQLRMSGRAHLDGWVLFPNRTDDPGGRESEVVLGPRTRIRGALYNAATTEMSGTVFGTVFARRFAFYQSPTHYVNWLQDATIDVTERPSDFASPFGFEASERPHIIRWREGRGDAL